MRVLPLPPLPDIEAVFFRLENQGSRYTLCRDVDVPKPSGTKDARSTKWKRYSIRGSCMGCMAADRINGQITVTKIDKARRSILVAGERSNAGRYVAIHLKSLTGLEPPCYAIIAS